MLYLKQSTAATIKLGPFVDDSDGKTAETGLTISQADIRLSKNGGDIAQTNNSAGATHDELGYYNVPLDTTDTNTLGTLKVIVSVSGALPVFADFMVITAEAYDTLCGTDHFTVDLNSTQLAAILEDTGTTIPGLINELDGKLDTVDTVVDGIQADLSNETDGLGALKALIDGLNNVSSSDVETACDAAIDNAISSPTANSLGFYMQKMFTALVNKMVVTEASGDTEQFDDSGVSIGTISGAITSDGTYTTRLRMVQ